MAEMGVLGGLRDLTLLLVVAIIHFVGSLDGAFTRLGANFRTLITE